MNPSPTGEPPHWEKGESRVLASTRILELRSVHFRHPGREAGREFVIFHAPDWVNVVAVTAAGEIVLVRQFRFGTGSLSLEVPGGVIEAGEDPVEAGVRELREETGYVGTAARLIGTVHPNPAIQDNRCHIVLVEGAVLRSAIEWDADEEIAVCTAPVSQVADSVRCGRITHALTVAALQLYQGLSGAGLEGRR